MAEKTRIVPLPFMMKELVWSSGDALESGRAPQGLLRCSSGSAGGSLVVTQPGLWPWSPMGPTGQTRGSTYSTVSWRDERSMGRQEAPWPCLHGPHHGVTLALYLQAGG